MVIARWLFLLAGLAICASIGLYFLTRNAIYWRLAGRIFAATLAAGLVFFVILVLERTVAI